jgi:hypothetical protein
MVYISPSFRVEGEQVVQLPKGINDAISVRNTEDNRVSVTPVDIYIDRLNGWLFGPLSVISPNPAAGFIVLSSLTQFFEAHAQYEFGVDTDEKGINSGDYFRRMIESVVMPHAQLDFTASDKEQKTAKETATRAIWKAVRNGLFHDGMIRYGIVLDRTFDAPITIIEPWRVTPLVVINTHELLEVLSRYFNDNYVPRLKSDETIRRNFEMRWKKNLEHPRMPGDASTKPRIGLPQTSHEVNDTLSSEISDPFHADGTVSWLPQSLPPSPIGVDQEAWDTLPASPNYSLEVRFPVSEDEEDKEK